jgi:hypothetical protein
VGLESQVKHAVCLIQREVRHLIQPAVQEGGTGQRSGRSMRSASSSTRCDTSSSLQYKKAVHAGGTVQRSGGRMRSAPSSTAVRTHKNKQRKKHAKNNVFITATTSRHNRQPPSTKNQPSQPSPLPCRSPACSRH